MREITYVKAFNEALMQLMAEDDDVFVHRRGRRRLRRRVPQPSTACSRTSARSGSSTPRSPRWASSGMGVGAAARGLRPVVDLMFMDFLGVCIDQLVNQAAKMKYMFGGDVTVPLTLTTAGGAGLSAGPQHSQSLEAWLAHVPGLKVAMPAIAARRQGPDGRGRPRRQPDRRHPQQAAARRQGRGARGDLRDPVRPGERGARRARTSRSSRSAGWCPRRWRPRSSSPPTASRPRSSTRAPCSRWTPRRIVESVRRTNRARGRARGGHVRRDRRRDRLRRSRKRRSTTSTRRCCASARRSRRSRSARCWSRPTSPTPRGSPTASRSLLERPEADVAVAGPAAQARADDGDRARSRSGSSSRARGQPGRPAAAAGHRQGRRRRRGRGRGPVPPRRRGAASTCRRAR